MVAINLLGETSKSVNAYRLHLSPVNEIASFPKMYSVNYVHHYIHIDATVHLPTLSVYVFVYLQNKLRIFS
jgi:hypothetical protein